MAFRKTKDLKMVNETKVIRIFSRIDAQSFGIGLVTGCILVSLTYFTMSKTDVISYPILNSQAVLLPSNTSFVVSEVQNVSSTKLLDVMKHSTKECDHNGAESDLCEKVQVTEMHESLEKEKTSVIAEKSENQNQNQNEKIAVTKKSSTSTEEIQELVISNSNSRQSGLVLKRKPLCDFSERRSAICDMEGDIRIIGKNLSSVIQVDSSQFSSSLEHDTYRVKPYPRKWDSGSMKNVRVVNVKVLKENAPQCSVNHSVPAIVFSISGFTGNYFHDMTDVLVPLFQTSRQFNGQVQFVITNYKAWWIGKYSANIKRLSVYDIIDYDNDDRVHCFKQVIVGLRSDRDLMIDPTRSPNGYTMTDFMKFMRESYGLKRDYALKIDSKSGKRPRLLLISRARTRKFMNVNMIVQMANKVGFEVVVAEANFGNVAEFSHNVNSCDVMMGVHGAGLTNFVFLPMNAVLIQVVPYGQLDWIATTYFGEPSKYMNLSYLEYTISVDESTLTELYDRNDPVFKDPKSIHKLGWFNMGAIYLDKQNVKLDVKRFKPVLQKAIKLLH